MTATDQLTDEQFRRHTLEILARELGPDGLARYFRLHPIPGSDYTRDRDKILGDITLEQILAEIEERRRQNQPTPGAS